MFWDTTSKAAPLSQLTGPLLQALIEPEAAETDLVVDAAHITEYVRFLDTHIKPLLSQAVAAAMRARSESMLQFVIKFLEDANVQVTQKPNFAHLSTKAPGPHPLQSPPPRAD